ncbi:MAG TPA: hypothetical protein VGW12_04105 [Pyrinomonadaceae bacterium]|nr:hypothetical protein [Pyrinomonadaceae bacterium]
MERERTASVRRTGGGALGAREAAACVLLVALFVGVRLWRLDASCLWFDEVFSVHAARHEWGALLQFVALDLVHPPLFYLLLKAWMALVGGEAVWWLRLFPLTAQTAALVPFLLLGRELRLRFEVVSLALLLLGTSGYLIQHAQQLRMYSLLLLFTLCSLWLFARFSDMVETRPPRPLVALALFACNLLLVYTHYFGWLLVGAEAVFLCVWRREKLKSFAFVCIALVVCFAPWAWLVWRAASAAGEGLAQNIGWVARPRLADVFQPYLLLHEPFRFRRHTYEPVVLRVNAWLAALLFVPPFVALCLRGLKRRRAGETPPSEVEIEQARVRDGDAHLNSPETSAGGASASTFLLFFSLLPVVVAFVLSLALPQSIWGLRHLVIIAPAYVLLASLALVSLRRPLWLAPALKILLACWLTLAAILWLVRRDVPPVWCAWETLAHRVVQTDTNAAVAADEIKIYAAEDLVAYHLWYALSSTADKRFRVVTIKNLPGLSEDRAFFLPRGFDEVSSADASAAAGLREEHFWLAFRATSLDASHPLLRLLSERGYDTDTRFQLSASGQTAFLISATRRKP